MRKTIMYAMLSALILTGAAMGVSADEAEPTVAYTPSVTTVAPGGTFDVTVHFNGIENALGYAVMLGDTGWESIVLDESGPAEAAETKAPLFAADPNDANDVAAAYLEETTLSGDYVKYTFTVPESAADGKVALTFTTKVLDKNNNEISGSAEQTVEVAISSSSSVDVTVAGKGDNVPAYTVSGNTLTVTYDLACKVGYLNTDSTYTAIAATANNDGSYSYTIPEGVTNVTVVVKGDANGDGKITMADATRIKAAYNSKVTFDSVTAFASDASGDGKITMADATRVKAVYNSKTTLGW